MPKDINLYINCAEDTVKMLRNHPSLCFWCGGNELNPPKLPPKEIDDKLRECIIPKRDGTRLYIPSSQSEGLGPSDGPYGILDPKSFFTNPQPIKGSAFNPEIGSVGTPVVESMRKMMPAGALEDFPKGLQCTDKQPCNDVWTFHTYIPYVAPGGVNLMEQYGIPNTIEEFCLRAQILNYIQYKSLIEAYNANMWKTYTGVLIWKSQNPWTGLRGQLYDWYLDQTGGAFGIRYAAEPVHIQLNLNDNQVIAVNNLFKEIPGATAHAGVYDLEGSLIKPYEATSSVPALGTQPFFKLEFPPDCVCFARLELKDADGHLLSENFYWLSTCSPQDFTSLKTLPEIDPETTLEISVSDENYNLKVTLKNPEEKGVAFFIRLKLLLKAVEGERVLPSFYDDNYFSLLPGEEKTVQIQCNRGDAGDEEPDVWIEGWNVAPRQILPGDPVV